MAARRDLPQHRRSRRDRDPLRGRQRVPRHARQPSGGPRRAHARHVHQRLPRDVADPPRRGRVRLRQDRPDDRQRAGQQADEALRRRRAAPARDGRPRGLRAQHRLPRRHLAARLRVAHPLGQAGAGAQQPNGVLHRAAPRADDAGDHDARRRRPSRRVEPGPQPPGRRRRVPRDGPLDGSGLRPAQGRRVHRAGPRAARALELGSSDDPGLPLRLVADDDRGRRRPRDHDGEHLRGSHRDRARPGSTRLPRRRQAGQADLHHQGRRLPHLPRGAGARALRPVPAHARPGPSGRRAILPGGAGPLARPLLGVVRHRDRGPAAGPAGRALEPLPARPGERALRSARRARQGRHG